MKHPVVSVHSDMSTVTRSPPPCSSNRNAMVKKTESVWLIDFACFHFQCLSESGESKGQVCITTCCMFRHSISLKIGTWLSLCTILAHVTFTFHYVGETIQP